MLRTRSPQSLASLASRVYNTGERNAVKKTDFSEQKIETKIREEENAVWHLEK